MRLLPWCLFSIACARRARSILSYSSLLPGEWAKAAALRFYDFVVLAEPLTIIANICLRRGSVRRYCQGNIAGVDVNNCSRVRLNCDREGVSLVYAMLGNASPM